MILEENEGTLFLLHLAHPQTLQPDFPVCYHFPLRPPHQVSMEDDPFGALDQESRAYVFFHDVMMKRYFDKEYQKSAEMAEELLMVGRPILSLSG